MEPNFLCYYDTSESQLSNLTLRNLHLEQENRRLQYEFEISDRRVSELARELSVVTEREKKGIEWYETLISSVKVLKDQKAKILMEVCEKNEEFNEKIGVLEREKSEFVAELDGLRREKGGLVVVKSKADEEMEKMRRVLEDEIKDLTAELCEKYEEICDLKGVERKNEGEIKELFERNEVIESELERVKRKVMILEMEKRAFEVKFDELYRDNERLVADVKEKDERVEEFKRKLKDLEVSRKYEKVEERLSKVEEDVANWLLENMPIAKKVMGHHVENVISSVLIALDSQQDGWTDPVADIGKREVNATSSFEKEVLSDTEVHSDTVLSDTEILSDTEVRRVKETIGVKRDASHEVIALSDSDCDNEDHSPLNELKRQRVLSQCRILSSKLDSCNQNSSCKFKQSMDRPNEDSELNPSIASLRSDKFVSSKKQDVAPLRQCNKTSCDKIKGPLSSGMVDGDGSQRRPQANVVCPPTVMELIASCRRSRHR